MPSTYWDGYSNNSTGQSTASYGWGNSWTSTSTMYYPVWTYSVIKKYLVEAPQSWTQEAIDKFIRLVNIDTRTGFRVEMVIKGDVLITDPEIEKRSMKDFRPLLSFHASAEDNEKIKAFFDEFKDEDVKETE